MFAIAVAVLAATPALGGERSAGVFIFTTPDGTRRVVNVPAASADVGLVPEGAAERRRQLWPALQDAARTHGVDPRLVDLVIRMESGYNPRAVSAKGARGVMQLMPDTALLYGVRNIFDPLENLRAGVHYLRDLLQRFNSDVALALAAYNAGPEAVTKHGGIPPFGETRNYVHAILAAYQGTGGAAKLAGGFGQPSHAAPPVELLADAGRPAIVNVSHAGEAPLGRPLALR
ncbi:MAG: lytic transglycosylase domain-containing protein [Thermoanaerobaculales bacterium]